MKLFILIGVFAFIVFAGGLYWMLGAPVGFIATRSDCSSERIIELEPTNNYSIEVHVSGWIEEGAVTIGGSFLKSKSITFTKSDMEISRSYVGDWYAPSFEITIKPTDDASCNLHIIHGKAAPYKNYDKYVGS